MKLSVIIPCYNPRATLADQLEALAKQQWAAEWETLLADNGSTDNFHEIAESFRGRLPDLRIVSCTAGKGAGYARNAAAAAADGEMLLFCDADDVVGPGWLPAMGNALHRHEFVAGRLDVTRINPPWAVAARPEVICLQRDGVMTTHDFLPWASSSNMGIRKKLFDKAGGFNKHLPAVEDVDLCWRVQRLGAKLAFAPDALVYYRLRDSLSGIFHQSKFYAENVVLLYKLHQPHGLAPPVPSVRSLLRQWYRLARSCPIHKRRREATGEWLWQVGWQWGCLKGSFKHRFFVP